ncbi:hypothetical protein OKHIF_19580 [Mycobacteroides chelonae]
MHREDAMLVSGELGELPHVVPDPLIRGMEQVRTVLMYLDTRLRLGLGVRVTADVMTALDDEDSLVQLGRGALSDGEAEKPGSDNDQVELLVFSGHVQSGYWTGTASP